MVLRLSAFFLVGSLCQAIEPDDLLGKSEFCKSISEEVTPQACQKTSALVPPATSPLEEIVRFQSKVSEVESASRAVKKNLFENAKISFVENLALAEWMSSEPVYVDKSLFGRAIQQTKQSCAGPLSESLDKILTNPEQRSLDFRMSPATTKNLKKVLKKKYLLAFIESSRLRRLLQDNYLREPTKTMAQKRLEKIQVSFPMTAQVHPPLLGSELEAAFGIPTNEMNSVAEGLWFDEYLFPDKPTLSLRTTAVPSSSKNRKDCDRLVCTSTGLIAQKIHDLDDLPLRAEKALIEAMRGHLIKSVESFAFLCQTDPCTAFSVNRDVTANTLQGIFDPLKQRRLQKEICACKILDPLEILSPNQTLGLLGAGVGLGLTCFGSLASGVLAGAATVACPSTAVVFAGLSAIQSAQHTQNFFRGDRHQRISDYLPALTPEQRLDGRKLGRDALESLPADIAISAGTLGAVKVGAPYVVEAGKKGLQFIQKGSKRAEESAATASSDLGKVERERRSPQKKFAGTEHRTSSLPSISKIPADNLKPVDLKPWPTLPDNLRILQGTRKNGETVHYYESAEKLKDGSVQISWGEIYFDKSTGALDCNYTSCRTFFQNMLKARSGKTHVGFLDVASVGKVNSEFQAGRKAGDALILDVYSKIMKAGEGKVSVARWGGDEFVFEIAEPDPFKAQAILKKIQNLVKDDLDGPGMQIFKDERKARQAAYQASPTAESKARLEDLDKIYGPNVSIGSAQFGVDDSLENVLQLAESQATVGKRSDKLRHGLSAEKYLDSRPPMDKPDLDYRPYVRPPIASPSWRNTQPKPQEKPDWNRGSHLEIAPVPKTEKRFGDSVLAVYEDAQRNQRTIVTRWEEIPKGSGQRVPVQIEIPTRGNTGVIDANHPESQRLITAHFTSEKDKVMLGIKLNNLHVINYFEQGTKAGDKILDAIGETIRNNTRAGDLTSKMGGKDFFQNLEATTNEGRLEIERRIRKQIAEHSTIKTVVAEEQRLLELKLSAAKAKGATEEVKRLGDKIQALASFKPQILIEHIRSGAAQAPTTFDEIIGKFEVLFKKGEP